MAFGCIRAPFCGCDQPAGTICTLWAFIIGPGMNCPGMATGASVGMGACGTGGGAVGGGGD